MARYAHTECIAHVRHPATRAAKGLCVLPSTDRAALVSFAGDIERYAALHHSAELTRRAVPALGADTTGLQPCSIGYGRLAKDNTRVPCHGREHQHGDSLAVYRPGRLVPVGGLFRHYCPAMAELAPIRMADHVCDLDGGRFSHGVGPDDRYALGRVEEWRKRYGGTSYGPLFAASGRAWADPAERFRIVGTGPSGHYVMPPDLYQPAPTVNVRPAERPADPAPAEPAPAPRKRAARPVGPGRPRSAPAPRPEPSPAPPAASPAPRAASAERPACDRCGQVFRKSGAGYAWHRMNRPDCAARKESAA